MIARKSDGLRAQEVLEAISETNERIKAFDISGQIVGTLAAASSRNRMAWNCRHEKLSCA